MQKVYVAYHKNPNEIEKSSSGAMFIALSDAILDKNGIIIAAAYDYNKKRLEHIICENTIVRDLCRGSKYIQSHIDGDIYRRIEDTIAMKIPVLYVGTPCQVAAVKQYLKVKKRSNDFLYTCDILCHGVGSPGIWKKFNEWKNKNGCINYLTFKDKRKGWKNPLCVAKDDKREISLRGYSWLYFSDAIMRPVCYECSFANTERAGDFTIGDYWKVKSKTPEMYNPRGTSFIMVNSEKGRELFAAVKKHIEYKEVSVDDIMQNNMQRPTKKSVYRFDVMKDFQRMNPAAFFKKWRLKLLICKAKKNIIPNWNTEKHIGTNSVIDLT